MGASQADPPASGGASGDLFRRLLRAREEEAPRPAARAVDPRSVSARGGKGGRESAHGLLPRWPGQGSAAGSPSLSWPREVPVGAQ